VAADDTHLQPYLQVVQRVAGMARSATAQQLVAHVPACPDWSVHQLLSHLVGLTEDWVSNELDGYATPAWAQGQADRHANEPIEEMLSTWDTAAEQFSRLAHSPLGSTPSRWAFGDAVTHESDLRPILAPGTRPPEYAVGLGVLAAVGRWRRTLADAGVAPLDVVATDLRSWAVGDPSQRESGRVGTVTTTAYELFRALYGRRSRAQIEKWDWTTDPAPYLDAGLPFPFTRPHVDLED
jgi:uncharacterized protein (TIGR03083 family)